MSKLRTFGYILKQGFQNITKNVFMIFASVSVIFVSLFILGGMYLITFNIEVILQDLSKGPAVTVNCSNMLSAAEEQNIYDELRLDERVLRITTVSRAENLENMRAYFEAEQDLFDDYTEDDMFVSYEVELKDISLGTSFVNDAAKMVGVNSVRDTVEVLQFFTTIKQWVYIGTVIGVIGLGILSFILTYNTIKLTVVARQSELEIMKYIGATNAYIRGPFVMEGMIMGVIGAVLAYFALDGVYSLIAKHVNSADSVNKMIQIVPFSSVGGVLLIIFLLAAVAIGIISGLIAIRKHLKV